MNATKNLLTNLCNLLVCACEAFRYGLTFLRAILCSRADKRRTKDEVIPPLGHFQREWVDACKGDLKTHCDFDYGGKAIEMMLLGLVAYRVGKKLDYDGAAGRVTNSAEANELLRWEYRPGWTLNG